MFNKLVFATEASSAGGQAGGREKEGLNLAFFILELDKRREILLKVK